MSTPPRLPGALVAVDVVARHANVDVDELRKAIAASQLAAWRIGQQVMVDRYEVADRFGVALPAPVVRPLRQLQPNKVRRPLTVSALVTTTERAAINEHLVRHGLGRRGGWARTVLLVAAQDRSTVATRPTARGPVHAVTCSVSPTERAAIDAAATHAGLVRSAWARAVLLNELEASDLRKRRADPR